MEKRLNNGHIEIAKEEHRFKEVELENSATVPFIRKDIFETDNYEIEIYWGYNFVQDCYGKYVGATIGNSFLEATNLNTKEKYFCELETTRNKYVKENSLINIPSPIEYLNDEIIKSHTYGTMQVPVYCYSFLDNLMEFELVPFQK